MPVSKKPRKKAKSKNKSQGDNVIGFVPNARDIEAFLGDILDDDNSQDPVQKAQSVMYEAWECSDPKQRFTLARKALRISPLCADAYNLLAEEYAKTQEEALAYFQRVVEAGANALGSDGFEDYAGHFWGFHETRPYMRARLGLGEVLWAMGEKDTAIQNFKEMLELNPGDNQGIRYILTAKLLEIGKMDDLKSLLKKCVDDYSADIQYTRALIAYSENAEDAQQIAEEAWKTNRHVPNMLSGHTPLIELSNYITIGGEDEATSYIGAFGAAWKRVPGSIEWLSKVTASL